MMTLQTKKRVDKLISGILTYKRMVKKKDLVKVFYIYICLCHVCPAHPCGDNPLRELVKISTTTGRDLENVLLTLRHININAYMQLRNEFQRYAACVGVVDTGYFKRSTDAVLPPLRKRFDSASNLDDVLETIQMPSVYDGSLERNNKNDHLAQLQQLRNLIKRRIFSLQLKENKER